MIQPFTAASVASSSKICALCALEKKIPSNDLEGQRALEGFENEWPDSALVQAKTREAISNEAL